MPLVCGRASAVASYRNPCTARGGTPGRVPQLPRWPPGVRNFDNQKGKGPKPLQQRGPKKETSMNSRLNELVSPVLDFLTAARFTCAGCGVALRPSAGPAPGDMCVCPTCAPHIAASPRLQVLMGMAHERGMALAAAIEHVQGMRR